MRFPIQKWLPKQRCKALTKDDSQCLRETRWFGRYCFQHTPKKLPLILAFFASVVPFASKEAYRHWFPSTESKQIDESRAQLQSHLDAQAEISSEIENLNIVLIFREPVSAEIANDAKVLVRVSQIASGQDRVVEVLGRVMYATNNTGERTWGFYFSAFGLVGDLDTKRGQTGYGMGTLSTALGELPIPLSIKNCGVIPFLKIRDLKESDLQLFLPEYLAMKVRQIDVVTNSSWQFERRLRILSKSISSTDWIEVDINPAGHFGSKEAPIKLWSLGSTSGRLLIDPRNAIWVKGEIMPETLRYPYQ